MANFQPAPGKVYPGFDASLNQFKIPMGNTTWKGPIYRDLGLWGGDDQGHALNLTLDDPTLATIRELSAPGGNVRVFRFYAVNSGETLLHARSQDGRDLTNPLRVLATGAEAWSEHLPDFSGGDHDTCSATIGSAV